MSILRPHHRLLIAVSLSVGLAGGPVTSVAWAQAPEGTAEPEVGPAAPEGENPAKPEQLVPEENLGSQPLAPDATLVDPDAAAEDTERPVPVAQPATTAPLAGAQRLDADGLFAGEQDAYENYMQGKNALADGDPTTAVAAWEQGLQKLPDERPYARSRGALALNLVRAHQLRYRQAGDPADLKRQISLLLGYQDRLSEMFPDDSTARDERRALAAAGIEQAEAELNRIEREKGTADEQLEKSLRGEYSVRTEESWGFDPTDLGWHPRPDDPRKHEAQATDAEAAPEEATPVEPAVVLEPRKAGTGLIISGAILTAAGVGGLAAGFAGMGAAAGANDFGADQTPSQRRAQIARGERGNQQALGGLVAGGVVAAVGVALLAVGAKKRKRSGRTVAVRPNAGKTSLGVTIAGRF